jgi:segregation and condensation protein A
MYNIKLEQFEGPLDLLTSLIEEQKLDITHLSLAKVADQYLEYINNKENITLDHLADFLTVASRLILIKSKALLPMLELSQEEEAEIKDLEKQLVEYKKFKDISKRIGKMLGSHRISFSREGFVGVQVFFYPPQETNVFDLKKTFEKVLSEIPVVEKLEEEMVRDVITLEDKISHLQETLRERLEMNFSEITSGAKDKIEVIVSFLAMLELVKQRIINVEQNRLFEEIKMKVKTE